MPRIYVGNTLAGSAAQGAVSYLGTQRQLSQEDAAAAARQQELDLREAGIENDRLRIAAAQESSRALADYRDKSLGQQRADSERRAGEFEFQQAQARRRLDKEFGVNEVLQYLDDIGDQSTKQELMGLDPYSADEDERLAFTSRIATLQGDAQAYRLQRQQQSLLQAAANADAEGLSKDSAKRVQAALAAGGDPAKVREEFLKSVVGPVAKKASIQDKVAAAIAPVRQTLSGPNDLTDEQREVALDALKELEIYTAIAEDYGDVKPLLDDLLTKVAPASVRKSLEDGERRAVTAEREASEYSEKLGLLAVAARQAPEALPDLFKLLEQEARGVVPEAGSAPQQPAGPVKSLKDSDLKGTEKRKTMEGLAGNALAMRAEGRSDDEVIAAIKQEAQSKGFAWDEYMVDQLDEWMDRMEESGKPKKKRRGGRRGRDL